MGGITRLNWGYWLGGWPPYMQDERAIETLPPQSVMQVRDTRLCGTLGACRMSFSSIVSLDSSPKVCLRQISPTPKQYRPCNAIQGPHTQSQPVVWEQSLILGYRAHCSNPTFTTGNKSMVHHNPGMFLIHMLCRGWPWNRSQSNPVAWWASSFFFDLQSLK